MKIYQKILSFYVATVLALPACNNEQAGLKQVTAKTVAVAKAFKSPYGYVNIWVDDFRNFRTAVYQDDLSKLFTYFSFPVNADSTQIWDAVYNSTDESKIPKTFPSTFTRTDFEKHYKSLFNNAFKKGLLKVKSEFLFKKGEFTTPLLKDGQQSFRMTAHYDKPAATLRLTISYPGGTDEEGNYVSEGEYAIIYMFKINNNKYLKFDKVLIAG